MVVQHLLAIHYTLCNKTTSHKGSKDELDTLSVLKEVQRAGKHVNNSLKLCGACNGRSAHERNVNNLARELTVPVLT